jgi:hypothetical protein
VPDKLHRYYGAGYLHFITTSCYRRMALLGNPRNRDLLLKVLEGVRRRYHFVVVGYVVMPEHVHLLLDKIWGQKSGTKNLKNLGTKNLGTDGTFPEKSGDRRDVPQFLRSNLGTAHKVIAISGSHTIPSLLGLAVARFARVVIVDVPHHVTAGKCPASHSLQR